MTELRVACPEVWPAATACHAWGAPSSHGCKLEPGHDGSHVCLCGRRESNLMTHANPQATEPSRTENVETSNE